MTGYPGTRRAGGGGGLYGGYKGGSSGSSIFGTGVAVSPAKKDEGHHGIGGFFQNLGDDIRDLQGIPAGIAHMGTSAWHDAKKATGFAGGQYRLDDIGKGIIKSYTDENTPTGEFGRSVGSLFSGDLGGAKRHYGGAWKAVYRNPLAPALDAAAAVTGGAAIAGKIATKTAVKTGSERAMRIAGLQRVDELTPSTIRGVEGPAGKFAAATHSIVDPLTKQVLYEKPVVRNPVVRARKAMVEKAYTKLSPTNPLSPTLRGVRLGEAQPRRVGRRDAANLERAYVSTIKKLKPDEFDALVYISQGFNNVERANRLIAFRDEVAVERAAAHATTPVVGPAPRKGVKAEKAKSLADVEDLRSDQAAIRRVMPHIEAPGNALQEALKAQRALNDVTQATYLRNLVRDGLTPEQAALKIRKRAQMPLRESGITPDVDEMPMILTHVESAAKRDKRGQDLERGMSIRTLDEELATTGENWRNAHYDRDPTLLLDMHRAQFAKELTHQRIERALDKAVPYDHAKHKKLVDDRKLKWVQRDDELVRDIKYVDDSLERFEAQVGDFSDAEVIQIREAYDAMHDLITQEGSPGVVLPMPHYKELAGQFHTGKNLLRELLAKPTKVWKHIVLSWKGSYYVNNFIGNMLLGVVAYGPRYIFDTARESLPAGLRSRTGMVTTTRVVTPASTRQVAEEVPPAPYVHAYDPSAASINAKEWYHGTGKGGLSAEQLAGSHTDHQGLFGQGIYLTDNPEVAKGYAKARSRLRGEPTIYAAKVNVRNALDLETAPHPDMIAEATMLLKRADWDGVMGDGWPEQIINDAAAQPGATNDAVFGAARRAIADHSATTHTPMTDYVESFGMFAEGMRARGYDALTHVGGQRVQADQGLHQVVIALDPEDIAGSGVKSQFESFNNHVPPPAAIRYRTESVPPVMGTQRTSVSDLIDENVSDLKRTAASSSVLNDSKTARWDAISRGGEFLQSKGALLTENNFRRAAYRTNLRRLEKSLKQQMPGSTRHQRIEAIFNDKNAVDNLAEQTYGDLLDYSKMTPFEKEYLLPLMPFWSFTRSMTGRTIRLTLDEPWKMRVLLYFGETGIEANEDALPDGLELPGYLKGLIMLDKTKELPRIFGTAGSNPFTAPIDLATQLLAIGGSKGESSNILSSFNPLLKAPLEAGIDKDMFMGREIENFDGSTPDGFAGRLGAQLQKQVPQWAMRQRYMHPSKYPPIERDAGDAWLQFAGLPVGDLNPENVKQIQNYIAADKARKEAAEAARVKAVAERAR